MFAVDEMECQKRSGPEIRVEVYSLRWRGRDQEENRGLPRQQNRHTYVSVLWWADQ